MTKKNCLLLLILPLFINSQTLNLNNTYFEELLRAAQLSGNLDSNISFTIRPLNIGSDGVKISKRTFDINQYFTKKNISKTNNSFIKILPVDYKINYNSHHPYNRNNGSMIPSRGFQQLISLGLFAKIGPLSIQLKPEHVYAENKDYDGFPETHYPVIWERRYILWNKIDLPEKFGDTHFKKSYIGQSFIKLNFKGMALGISSENIWWGPSIRNGINMSNHAKGFNHITFNTTKPLKSKIGNFEWQFITGRLESSGYLPPATDKEYAGRKLYVPKINQLGERDDWRYFQGITFTYSPKWINGLSVGLTKWTQMYSALIEGKYTWMEGDPNYFPLFSNLFRSNDKYENYEAQTDQAAGVFFRWLWLDSKAEFYGEFNYNDSKQNIRDLLLDSEHSRAVTLGVHKLFNYKSTNSFIEFNWEWTQLEQNSSRMIRNAGSWYMHGNVYDGYTNRGEVIGAGIGPGSNSQYLSISKSNTKSKIKFALEIIDQDNDFYHRAFEDSQDYRRYWKDYNFHFSVDKEFSNFWGSFNFVYIRSLNYQWELEDGPNLPYYHSGRDVNNFHVEFKLTYPIKL